MKEPSASIAALCDAYIDAVRTTITIDDELLARAQELTGTHEKSALVRQGLTALIAQESARRLALLGGSDPDAQAAPRERGRSRR